MKATIISNGTVRVSLTGENGVEKEALEHLCLHDICATRIENPINILHEKVGDGIIIETKTGSQKAEPLLSRGDIVERLAAIVSTCTDDNSADNLRLLILEIQK